MKRVQKLCSGEYCKSKGIARIYVVHYNPKFNRVERYSIELLNFLPEQKTIKRKYNWEESYNDYLIYNNDWELSTRKMALFIKTMNVENKVWFIRSKKTRLRIFKRRSCW